MLKRKKDINEKSKKRDIIEEYANFGSKVFFHLINVITL